MAECDAGDLGLKTTKRKPHNGAAIGLQHLTQRYTIRLRENFLGYKPTSSKGVIETSKLTSSKGVIETSKPTSFKGVVQTSKLASSKGVIETSKPTSSKGVIETFKPTSSKGVIETSKPTSSKEFTHSCKPSNSNDQIHSSRPTSSDEETHSCKHSIPQKDIHIYTIFGKPRERFFSHKMACFEEKTNPSNHIEPRSGWRPADKPRVSRVLSSDSGLGIDVEDSHIFSISSDRPLTEAGIARASVSSHSQREPGCIDFSLGSNANLHEASPDYEYVDAYRNAGTLHVPRQLQTLQDNVPIELNEHRNKIHNKDLGLKRTSGITSGKNYDDNMPTTQRRQYIKKVKVRALRKLAALKSLSQKEEHLQIPEAMTDPSVALGISSTLTADSTEDRVYSLGGEHDGDTRPTLKEKLNELLEHFAGETTAHGFKRTLQATRSSTGKIVWVLAIFAAMVLVLKVVTETVSQQNSYPLSVRTRSLSHHSLAFPAVTVCSLAPYNADRKTTLVMELGIKNGTPHGALQSVLQGEACGLAREADNRSMTSEADQMTLETLDQIVGWRLDSFIEVCMWQGHRLPCKNLFVRAKTSTDTCFTFNSDPDHPTTIDRVGSLSGLSLTVNLGMAQPFDPGLDTCAGVKVLIHDPRELPNPREQGLLVPPSTASYLGVTKEKYRFLPKPYRAYGSEFCSDEFYESYTPRFYNQSSYSGCVADCRLKTLIDKCACVVYAGDPVLPESENVTFCTTKQMLDCYIPTLRNFQSTSTHGSHCACPLPCTKVEYNSQISTASFHTGRNIEDQLDSDVNGAIHFKSKRKIELKVYMASLFTHVEEHVPKSSWSDTLAKIGGTMGLLSGASVLTLLEFLELAFLITVWSCRFAFCVWSQRE